jgi:crossover junction endodeoxyribonuclease RuvC
MTGAGARTTGRTGPAAIRVLGIDPGLTRCGIGVVDIAPDRRPTLVHVSVVRSSPDDDIAHRLLTIGAGIEALLDEFAPQAVALEQVFAQQNLKSVMGVAQISGVALHESARRGLPVGMHTPSEVKAAITGYGDADKRQVGAMVARVLGLAEVPKPADASDALALAVCHGWRRGMPGGAAPDPRTARPSRAPAGDGALTPAQRAWRAAERGTRT